MLSADVLVVGGGITGAGVARDAAMRGLQTVLIEQSDFASGTSSRSSRLLHGGLRYLAQGQIRLVREASVEKMRLCRLAPHLCHPLQFFFPVWQGDAWALWKLALGVRIYDLLCGGRNLGRSASFSASGLAASVPGLRQAGLKGGVAYFDALTNDARLVIDTLRSAANSGASLHSYCRLVSANRTGSFWACDVHDLETNEFWQVQAAAVVNATGAWAQGIAHSSVHLRLTKGVHLVVDRDRLPVESAVVLSEGQRILFVIPWGERLILGTTDTDYQGDPAAVRTGAEDVHYILNVVNGAFPGARITVSDVISTWAGVRPLIAPRHINADAPSSVPRRHEIRMPEPGWFDVAGGKLTTYRLMAEQVVDRIGAFLNRRLPESPTRNGPLNPGEADSLAAAGVLPPPLEAPVVDRCCRREWTRHLNDLLLRRTSWHYYYPVQARVGEQASHWMARAEGWTEERRRGELAGYYAEVETSGYCQPPPSAR